MIAEKSFTLPQPNANISTTTGHIDSQVNKLHAFYAARLTFYLFARHVTVCRCAFSIFRYRLPEDQKQARLKQSEYIA
jgi:hypothetical protein